MAFKTNKITGALAIGGVYAMTGVDESLTNDALYLDPETLALYTARDKILKPLSSNLNINVKNYPGYGEVIPTEIPVSENVKQGLLATPTDMFNHMYLRPVEAPVETVLEFIDMIVTISDDIHIQGKVDVNTIAPGGASFNLFKVGSSEENSNVYMTIEDQYINAEGNFQFNIGKITTFPFGELTGRIRAVDNDGGVAFSNELTIVHASDSEISIHYKEILNNNSEIFIRASSTGIPINSPWSIKITDDEGLEQVHDYNPAGNYSGGVIGTNRIDVDDMAPGVLQIELSSIDEAGATVVATDTLVKAEFGTGAGLSIDNPSMTINASTKQVNWFFQLNGLEVNDKHFFVEVYRPDGSEWNSTVYNTALQITGVLPNALVNFSNTDCVNNTEAVITVPGIYTAKITSTGKDDLEYSKTVQVTHEETTVSIDSIVLGPNSDTVDVNFSYTGIDVGANIGVYLNNGGSEETIYVVPTGASGSQTVQVDTSLYQRILTQVNVTVRKDNGQYLTDYSSVQLYIDRWAMFDAQTVYELDYITNQNQWVDASPTPLTHNLKALTDTTISSGSPSGYALGINGFAPFSASTLNSLEGGIVVATPNDELNMGTGAFTVEASLLTNELTNTFQPLVQPANASAPLETGFILIAISGNKGPNPGKLMALVGGKVLVSTNPVPVATWYEIAICRDDSGNLRLYINGALDKSSTGHSGTATLSSTDVNQGMVIGTDLTAADSYENSMLGFIDRVRVTKGAARYNADYDVDSTYWKG